MLTMRLLFLLAAGLAFPAFAQLAGRVVSPEGALEGVVVSARKAGSSVTVSVVSDAEGRFSFPAAKLEPGSYALRIRATGYELESPRTAELADGASAPLELRLREARDLSAQLTNAEWLASFPGTPDQKKFLYGCVGCHTLERIAKSGHDAAEFRQVMKRMAGYTNNSHVDRPQVRLRARDPMRDFGPDADKNAAYLATVNQGSGARPYALQALPRAKGRSTRVVITEYELPRKPLMPHDVIVDRDGIVWFSQFDEQFLGRFDPKTRKYTEFPIPVQRPDYPKGTLDLEVDPEGNLWLSHMFQSGVVKFDKKTQTFQAFPLPAGLVNEDSQQSMVGPQRWTVDRKLWLNDAGIPGMHRLDMATGKFETWKPYENMKGPHEDREAHALPDAHAALAAAPRQDGRRGPHLVRRVARGKDRHVRHADRDIPRVAGADAVYGALRRRARQVRESMDGGHEHRSRPAHGPRERRVRRISSAQPDQHPPRVHRRRDDAADVLGRQQPPRHARQGRAARLRK